MGFPCITKSKPRYFGCRKANNVNRPLHRIYYNMERPATFECVFLYHFLPVVLIQLLLYIGNYFVDILDPTTCGFGKMAVYVVLTEVRSRGDARPGADRGDGRLGADRGDGRLGADRGDGRLGADRGDGRLGADRGDG